MLLMIPASEDHIKSDISEKRAANLDEMQLRFRRRYILKKTINMLMSFFIVFCGVTAVLYSVYIIGSNLFDRLRYMTFDGTIYTTVMSAAFTVVCIIEAVYETEITNRFVYFIRLSSAVTEFIIFAVVMFGLTPLVPDRPDIVTYTGFVMHIIIPTLTLICFIFNDAPIGRVKWYVPLNGTVYITLYAVIMVFVFATGILPPEKAPYSFFDFKHSSPWFVLACGIGIYVIGYLISLLLIRLNNRMSWVWFHDLSKNGKPPRFSKLAKGFFYGRKNQQIAGQVKKERADQ